MLYAETDGTGVPVRASETEGRQGKSEDGKAGTREVKLARLFTVSRLDEDGRPVTDAGSSTYVATFDGKDALAGLVQAEYLRRGGEHFRQVVAIGDGAAWIWTMAGKLYPHATHIVDIYHAREHLHDLAAHLAFITPDPAQWLQTATPTWTPATSAPSSAPPAATPRRHQGQRPGQEARLLRAQRAPDALPALRDLGMFTGSVTSREASTRSSSSTRNSPACTGPSTARPTSSRCAASTPAAGGTTSLRPRSGPDPGLRAPSDRHRDSEPKLHVKIIPTKLSCTSA